MTLKRDPATRQQLPRTRGPLRTKQTGTRRGKPSAARKVTGQAASRPQQLRQPVPLHDHDC
jgi:hypothetical protein